MNILLVLGQIRGLLGNFNGDDNDDFVSRQNTVLPSDASMEDLHYKFGMTCKFVTKKKVSLFFSFKRIKKISLLLELHYTRIAYIFYFKGEVQSTESLFTRPNTGVNTVNYEPVFLDDIRNPELNLTFVVELCGDNKQCQYDYSVTGNENIAKGTMKFIEKFKEIEIDVQEGTLQTFSYS